MYTEQLPSVRLCVQIKIQELNDFRPDISQFDTLFHFQPIWVKLTGCGCKTLAI